MALGRPVKAVGSIGNDSKAEAGVRRRGRPKAVPDPAQRQHVVRAAYHLFVSQGFGGTTMDAVAAQCRMSKRTLYRLFPGKVDLFAAVVESHRQSMLALPGNDDGLPLATALEAIFRIDITPQEERDRGALLRLVMVEGPQFPELQTILDRCGGEWSRMALAEWLAAHRLAGQIADTPGDTQMGAEASPCRSTYALAGILMDMVFGAALPKASGKLEWVGGAQQRAHVRSSGPMCAAASRCS